MQIKKGGKGGRESPGSEEYFRNERGGRRRRERAFHARRGEENLMARSFTHARRRPRNCEEGMGIGLSSGLELPLPAADLEWKRERRKKLLDRSERDHTCFKREVGSETPDLYGF